MRKTGSKKVRKLEWIRINFNVVKEVLRNYRSRNLIGLSPFCGNKPKKFVTDRFSPGGARRLVTRLGLFADTNLHQSKGLVPRESVRNLLEKVCTGIG